MASIKYDSTELVNATYNVRSASHESMPQRQINRVELTRDDGSVIISDKFKEKTIVIKGVLTAATKNALDTAMDNFKELMAREDKNLDIEFTAGGTYRRYVARAVSVDIVRDFYNMLFVPYTVEFLVPSGMGNDTASIKALDVYEATITPQTGSWSAGGSAPPIPSIKLRMAANWSTIKGIKFENTDTDEYIIYTSNVYTWDAGDIVTIYCDDKQVSYNDGSESFVDFIGVFPTFKIGTNNYKLTAGDIEFESYGIGSTVGSGQRIDDVDKRIAMGFRTTYKDATFQGIAFVAFRYDNPGNMIVRIETDNDGKPSGTLADVNSTFTVAEGDVTTGSGAWTSVINSTNLFTLDANTLYWIVFSVAGADGVNYYEITESSPNAYGKGNMSLSDDAGVSWTDNPTEYVRFAIYFGGKAETSSTNIEVNYTKRYL